MFHYKLLSENFATERDIAGLEAVTTLVLQLNPHSATPTTQTGYFFYKYPFLELYSSIDLTALLAAINAFLTGLTPYIPPVKSTEEEFTDAINISIDVLKYKGLWNATTNIPILASGIGHNGDLYIVSVSGNTNLDGITNWIISDWALFNGVVWQKADHTNLVISVNSKTGAVSLDYSDVGAEQAFSKSTGFNLNLGTSPGTVSEGNHTHSGLIKYYGLGYNIVQQSFTANNTDTVLNIDTIPVALAGIQLIGTTQLKVLNAGVYKISYSVNVLGGSAVTKVFTVTLRQDGITPIAYAIGKGTTAGTTDEKTIAGNGVLISLAANAYFEILCQTSNQFASAKVNLSLLEIEAV